MPSTTKARHSPRFLLSRDAPQVLLRTPTTQYFGSIFQVSTHTVGLVLGQNIQPGTVVVTQLTNSCRLFCCDLEMRVVQCVAQANDRFLIACEFTSPLPHETVRALLR
jgi:hypothetical protein